MALLICPECGAKVSEHAKACPSCGCTITYIKKFYAAKKVKEVKKKSVPKAKPKKQITPAESFYSSLSANEKAFLKKVSETLRENKIDYLFDNGKTAVGYRKSKEDKLFCYLSKRTDNKLYIAIRRKNSDDNYVELFDIQKTQNYIAMMLSYVAKSTLSDDQIIGKKISGSANYIYENGSDNVVERPKIVPESQKIKFDDSLEDKSIYEVHVFLDFMIRNNFEYVDDKKCIKFYSRADKKIGVTRSWFYIVKDTMRDTFTKRIIPTFTIHYYLNPEDPDKMVKETFYNYNNLSSKLIDVVSRTVYHRQIKLYLTSFSIYWNIIKATCGYGTDFNDQFKVLLKYKNIKDEEPVCLYEDAIDFYKQWKADIVYRYLSNKLNKAKSYMSVITNESDFKKSIKSAVSSKSYSLASLLGVTKDILNYLDDDYETIVDAFTRFDCESISDRILQFELIK